MSASSSATCCESAPRSVSDVGAGSTPAAAAATLCLAPYDGRLLGSARPELGTALGIYGAPYAAAAAAAQSYPGYLPYSPEPPTLYGALVSTPVGTGSVRLGQEPQLPMEFILASPGKI